MSYLPNDDPFFSTFVRPRLENSKKDALERMEGLLDTLRAKWQSTPDQLERVGMMASLWAEAMPKVTPNSVAEMIAALQERIFSMESMLHAHDMHFDPLAEPREVKEAPKCGLCGGEHETPVIPEDMQGLIRTLFNNN